MSIRLYYMENVQLEKPTEIKKLVQKAQAGDADAFGYLYEQYLTPIYRFLIFRLKNKEEAEDITQTIFLKAWQAIDKYEEQGHSFSTWLYTIAKNTLTDHWKKKKAVLVAEPETIFEHLKDERQNQTADLEKKEKKQTLLKAIENLSEDQQIIIVLKFLQELSNQEIEVLTGKGQTAIRALQYRALKTLKRTLDPADI